MVDYRKRLSDMTPEERAEVAPSADNFSKVFGDRTEEPMSVTAADTAVSLTTPVDSVVEVQKELQKEEPDYLKIGMLAGVEALGSIPALGPVAKSMIRKGADLAKQTDSAIEGVGTGIPKVDMIADTTAGINNKTVTQSAVDLMNEPAFGEGFAEKLQQVAAENSIAVGDKTFSPMQVYTELKDRVNSDDFTVVPSKSKDSFDVEYDYDLTLKMEDMIDEWAMGNVSNADLRKNLATLDIKLPYRIGPKADPSSLDIQMPDGTIYKGTGDVPSKPRPLANFNKGGMAMEEQTQMAFALGGSVEEVDPVSGNEVPPGSLPEEVRDDIDARLSEGEYVVPADVVRYYGVKFFEDLRNQAKMGFEDMEANGRIGGQPVPEENSLPFDVSELQVEEEPVQMNEGGFLDRDALEARFPASFMGSGGPAQEWKTFENEAGLTITIRFVDGKPMSPIPAGYTEVGARSEKALEVPRGDDSDPQFGDPSNAPEAVDLSKLSEDELEKIGDKATTMGTLEEIVGYGTGPVLTQVMRMTREARAAKVNSEVASRLASGKNADGTDLTESQITQLGKIFDKTADTEDTGSRFFGGQRTLTEGLQDTSGDEQVGFADTFLGDLLGFDGQPGIQATDIEGNKLGLDASISGKRRKPVEKPTVTAPSNNDGGDDDNYSAADAMRDRLDKETKDEGQSGGFQGSVTSGSVYAGGNRAEGGLMLKKDKKKKKK